MRRWGRRARRPSPRGPFPAGTEMRRLCSTLLTHGSPGDKGDSRSWACTCPALPEPSCSALSCRHPVSFLEHGGVVTRRSPATAPQVTAGLPECTIDRVRHVVNAGGARREAIPNASSTLGAAPTPWSVSEYPQRVVRIRLVLDESYLPTDLLASRCWLTKRRIPE